MITRFYIDSECGEVKLGPLRFHWYNHGLEEDDPGFFIISWTHYDTELGQEDYNIEFGQVDQDRPGIYLTRYTYLYDVELLRTFVKL